MIDKGKYASHGVFIKKMNDNFLGKWSKPKMAVINPLPTAKPRQKISNSEEQNIKLNSHTFNASFKFQEPLTRKPIPEELIQPFLYVQKVLNKRKVDDLYKNDEKNKIKPFVTSKNASKIKGQPVGHAAPSGYANLYQFQTNKRNIATVMFERLIQANTANIKSCFKSWKNEPIGKQVEDPKGICFNNLVKEEEFVDFIKSLLPGRISTKHIKHFFKLYKNNASKVKGDAELDNGQISIRAFSYNFQKFKKAESEINNVMSPKFAKDRYTFLKKYLSDFLSRYPQLKIGMKGIKQYEETLRKHFKRLYESYKNPFEEEINELKQQLNKPIIKYDKDKKEKTINKIAEFETENENIHQKLTNDYNRFIQAYEQAIVKNHDLFFTKRTVAYLLWPIMEREPLLSRTLIEEEVGVRQEEKQKYLQTLSDLIVEIDNDKKNLKEDCFTLGEIVDIVTMKYRRKGDNNRTNEQQFTITSLKKLIKEIKRQFLLKFNLVADDPDHFPADQEIPLQILHTCFEMQCTKVLFKNRIWNEVIEMIPQKSIESKLHQKTIDSNTCMEYLKKYFKKLDQRSRLELNKSKEISLVVENAYNQNFGRYADTIWSVVKDLNNYVEGLQQQQEQNASRSRKKKVGFADIVESKLSVQRGQERLIAVDEEAVKNIIKMIHLGSNGQIDLNLQNEAHQPQNNSSHQLQQQEESPKYTAYQNLHMLKSMARSYFEPQSMNTNAFDIRFYEKIAEQEKLNKIPEEQVVQLGKSMLLMGAPLPSEIQGQSSDPLRISRFLLKTIDNQVKEEQKFVHNKQYERDIGQGVSNNYFQQKIKLEKRPARYDSEGKSKYSVLLPVGYYQSYIVGQSVPDQQKWYLRPHHVQTLTENPLSKKDNVIHTEYQSRLDKLGLKKRPDQFVIEENMKRKEDLILELEERIQALKAQVNQVKRSNESEGYKVNPSLVNDYYCNITDGKQDKELQLAAYEGVLYDLRKKERSLLNQYRDNETRQQGQPNHKWWQKKDKSFNRQLRKDRQIVGDSSGKHKSYVQKLKNDEVY